MSPRRLGAFRPSVVVALGLGERPLIARWDGLAVSFDPRADLALPITSSSYEQSEVQRFRRDLYAREVRGGLDPRSTGPPSAAALDAYHRWTGPTGRPLRRLAWPGATRRPEATAGSRCAAARSGSSTSRRAPRGCRPRPRSHSSALAEREAMDHEAAARRGPGEGAPWVYVATDSSGHGSQWAGPRPSTRWPRAWMSTVELPEVGGGRRAQGDPRAPFAWPTGFTDRSMPRRPCSSFTGVPARLPTSAGSWKGSGTGTGSSRSTCPDSDPRPATCTTTPSVPTPATARALMDDLGIERVHAVGFSMGGGVALELAASAPERVASLTLLASIGVIELEPSATTRSTTDSTALQTTAFRAARWLVPHFGGLDDSFLSYEYARNFQDTDQRRLRPALEGYDRPDADLHGEDDFLVPSPQRVSTLASFPQARLRVFPSPDGHFLPWSDGTIPPVTEEILSLVDRVASGTAPMRADADAARVAAADAPFDPREVPPFEGPALLAICALLAVATFVSEDLACIAAGLLVADGRLGCSRRPSRASSGSSSATCCCTSRGGSSVGQRSPAARSLVREGDLGRAREPLVRAARHRRHLPVRVHARAATAHLRRRRRPADAFRDLRPLLRDRRRALDPGAGRNRRGCRGSAAAAAGSLGADRLPWLIVLVIALLETYSTLPLLLTHRGRRVLRGRWIRRTRWEFWPPWITYLPVLPFIAWLGVKYRGLSKVTAVNPAMPAGGFVGESKTEILGGLGVHNEEIPAFVPLRASDGPDRRERAAADFIASRPGRRVVLKPDAGQRGSGVAMLEDPAVVARAHATSATTRSSRSASTARSSACSTSAIRGRGGASLRGHDEGPPHRHRRRATHVRGAAPRR